jgi:hypothetical protein
MYEASSAQYTALEKAREHLGRQWKSKLKTFWCHGTYPDCLKPYRAELQQLRNLGGNYWLDKFRFED